MAKQIPLRADLTDFVFSCSLDGSNYTLRFRWNTRETRWYMDIKTERGEPVALSLPVVVGSVLLKRNTNPLRPRGDFFAVDTGGNQESAGIADLGDRVQLLYFTEAELVAL